MSCTSWLGECFSMRSTPSDHIVTRVVVGATLYMRGDATSRSTAAQNQDGDLAMTRGSAGAAS